MRIRNNEKLVKYEKVNNKKRFKRYEKIFRVRVKEVSMDCFDIDLK